VISVVIADDEPLARERLRTLVAEHADLALVAECGDGRETVATLAKVAPDLVFLDIQMPELDGFGVLEALAPANRPAVVFVTAYDEYAIQAFEVNAIDYLLKPVDPVRFDEALGRARSRLALPDAGRLAEIDRLLAELRRARGYPARLVARLGSAVSLVAVEEIDWIEARGNYAGVHVGRAVHLVREPLRSLEARLDPDRFARVHRSAIVNLERIATVEPYFHGEYVLTLRDGTRLTSSRTQSAKLRALLR
jgi:two-component system LytT family response regulator